MTFNGEAWKQASIDRRIKRQIESLALALSEQWPADDDGDKAQKIGALLIGQDMTNLVRLIEDLPPEVRPLSEATENRLELLLWAQLLAASLGQSSL